MDTLLMLLFSILADDRRVYKEHIYRTVKSRNIRCRKKGGKQGMEYFTQERRSFTWELVQEEMERRRNMDARYSSVSIFSPKIKCSECGNWYSSKVWHSQDKYRRVIFQCNRKFKNDKNSVDAIALAGTVFCRSNGKQQKICKSKLFANMGIMNQSRYNNFGKTAMETTERRAMADVEFVPQLRAIWAEIRKDILSNGI